MRMTDYKEIFVNKTNEMKFTHVHKYTLICFAHFEYRPDTNPHTETQDRSKLYKKMKYIGCGVFN